MMGLFKVLYRLHGYVDFLIGLFTTPKEAIQLDTLTAVHYQVAGPLATGQLPGQDI